MEGHLPSFAGATGWLNSDPLTPEGLRGRVVLVDFWTYTCVNWLRTLPYVRAWAAKYADQGLTTIGVHTPEFDFEHDVDNIIAQARALDVPYPIAVDSDYGVWNAFDNHYWPAVYIADAQGRIRYHHFGEGEYAMQEMVIQQLLVGGRSEGRGPWIWCPSIRSGSKWRPTIRPCAPRRRTWGTARRPGWPRRTVSGPMSRTTTPGQRDWSQRVGAGGKLVDLAARRHGDGAERPARLPLPGPRREPGDGTGRTRDRDPLPRLSRRPAGNRRARHRRRLPTAPARSTEQRTYQLIRQPDPIDERTFEIEFLAPGVELFCFTFG